MPRVSTFNFETALTYIKANQKVSRNGWNGKNQYLRIQIPDAGSMNTLPYIYIITVDGDRVPWVASQTDLLAEDWILVI